MICVELFLLNASFSLILKHVSSFLAASWAACHIEPKEWSTNIAPIAMPEKVAATLKPLPSKPLPPLPLESY